MTSPCCSRPRINRGGLIAPGLIAGLLLGQPAAAQTGDQVLLAPTPLILKDGRIANVSVHVVPFPAGTAEVAASTRRELAVLTRDAATDCFLTAQVIGHVGSSEISGNETLTAHRLARSRADAVQASLIDGGLPAKAIASVWDWQFMVREPRATLWMFSLTEGEDCEGEPLAPGAAAVVAETELAPPENAGAAPPPQPEPAAAPTREPRTLPTPTVTDQSRPRVQAEAAAPEPPASRPGSVAVVPAGPAPAEPPTARARTPVPAMSPSEPVASRSEPSARQRAPAPPPSEPVVAALEDPPHPKTAVSKSAAATEDETGGVSDAGDSAVAITFATNSSYLPPGTQKRLRSLISELSGNQRYRVRLQAAVSGSQKVVGASSAAEAARYNKWLAERRIDRLRSWLSDSVQDRELIIEPEFLAGDESRRVIVEVSPAG